MGKHRKPNWRHYDPKRNKPVPPLVGSGGEQSTTASSDEVTEQDQQPSVNPVWRVVLIPFRLLRRLIRWFDNHNGTVTAAATAAVAVLTLYIVHDAHEQIHVIGDQAKVMRDQLGEMRVEQRPWVVPEISVSPEFKNLGLFLTKDGATITLDFAYRNGGKSVAVKTAPYIHLVALPIGTSIPDTMDTWKELCTRAEILSKGFGEPIMPGTNPPIRRGVQTDQGVYLGNSPTIQFVIEGCVAYYTDGDPTPHHTPFLYTLHRVNVWDDSWNQFSLRKGHYLPSEVGLTNRSAPYAD